MQHRINIHSTDTRSIVEAAAAEFFNEGAKDNLVVVHENGHSAKEIEETILVEDTYPGASIEDQVPVLPSEAQDPTKGIDPAVF